MGREDVRRYAERGDIGYLIDNPEVTLPSRQPMTDWDRNVQRMENFYRRRNGRNEPQVEDDSPYRF